MKLITLDTNVIIALVKPERKTHSQAVRLLELHQSGKCDVVVTSRVDKDVPHDPLRSAINQLEIMATPIGAPARVGSSRVGGPDQVVGEDVVQMADRMMQTIFSGVDELCKNYASDMADIDHLLGHWLSRRDVFVTEDGPILESAPFLIQSYGIRVLSLQGVLEEIEGSDAALESS